MASIINIDISSKLCKSCPIRQLVKDCPFKDSNIEDVPEFYMECPIIEIDDNCGNLYSENDIVSHCHCYFNGHNHCMGSEEDCKQCSDYAVSYEDIISLPIINRKE